MKYRKQELILNKKVYVDEETHQLLRQLKKKNKKSMARIVKDLVYKKSFPTL